MATVAVYLSLAAMLPTSMAVGYFIGLFLDRAFGTHFLYLVFLLLGIVSGMLQLLRQVMRDSRDDGR
ncbi:MAG: AtpZ/AtpI family protein [Acidobacteriia bacterium]|nr:AtpZ/AtpI family protein [Terriglobia bacterium]